MIVRPAGRRLHLITQPDHAALSRRIMEQWKPLDDEARRTSILLAVGEHDNGWREPDDAPTVDAASGRIHDFISAPAHVRQGVWPRGIARLEHDPWAAALVAEHAITVYNRYTADPEWAAFFTNMHGARDRLVIASGRSLDDLVSDYAYVRIGDLISLVFCNGWSDAQQYGGYSFVLSGDRIVVSPDAFGGRLVPITVSAIDIENRPFASDDQLRRALRSAPRVSLSGFVRAA